MSDSKSLINNDIHRIRVLPCNAGERTLDSLTPCPKRGRGKLECFMWFWCEAIEREFHKRAQFPKYQHRYELDGRAIPLECLTPFSLTLLLIVVALSTGGDGVILPPCFEVVQDSKPQPISSSIYAFKPLVKVYAA